MAEVPETHPARGTGREDTSREDTSREGTGGHDTSPARAPRRIEAVISDFGGVLTSPLAGSFQAFQDTSGVPLQELGKAMAAIAARLGVNPLFELETGRLSEVEFLRQIGV